MYGGTLFDTGAKQLEKTLLFSRFLPELNKVPSCNKSFDDNKDDNCWEMTVILSGKNAFAIVYGKIKQ